MARREYYPEYYLKKRQKDAVFNRVWKTVIVLFIVALGVAAGYLIYKQIVEPRRQPSDNTSALAGLKGDLEAQERLQNAASQAPREDVDEATRRLAQETDLEEIAYVQSFPQIHVSVAGSSQPVSRGSDATAADGGPAATTEADGDAASGSDSSGNVEGNGDGGENASSAAQQEDSSAKQTEEEKEPVKPAAVKPAGPPSYEYKIYAGSYPSQGDADEGKRGLGALGLTGTIIKNGADYNLLVGTLENFEAALALRKKLEDSGYGSSFVTRKTR